MLNIHYQIEQHHRADTESYCSELINFIPFISEIVPQMLLTEMLDFRYQIKDSLIDT
jgi:hypothetical protein